jgi:vanillate O-demethylase monooxygenase subunit
MTAPWLRNAWYAAAWSADVAPGTQLARTIVNEPVVLFRQPHGTLVAFADVCPHRLAPLSFGTVLPNGNFQCGYHGLQFDAGGTCVHNPHGNGKITANLTVRTFPVLEKYGVAWVWPGEGAPNASALADFAMFENVAPLHSSLQEYIRVDAPYTLLQDNLMDASHVPYVHLGTLGNAGEMSEEPETVLEQNGDTVAITRTFRRTKVIAIIDLMYRSGGRPADTFNTIRWDPPGSILVFSGAFDSGNHRETGTGYGAMHLLTPETETTTHYHFWAVRWNPRDPDEGAAQQVLNVLNTVRRKAFEEQDAPIIEAQSRTRLRLGPARQPSMLFTDAAAARVQRILDARIAAETAELVT